MLKARRSRVLELSGQQQNWPTQPGSLVTAKYVMPAYIHSWPNRPYIVLGYLDGTTAPIRRRGAVPFAARRAKEFGADAIIVMEQGQYAGSLSNGSAFTSGNLYNNGFTASTIGTGFSALPPRRMGTATTRRAGKVLARFRSKWFAKKIPLHKILHIR